MAASKIVALLATVAASASGQSPTVPTCAIRNLAYTNDQNLHVNGGYAPDAAQCQRVCASQPYACDMFTFYNDSNACWLLKENGTVAVQKAGAVSGPQRCVKVVNGTETVVETPKAKAVTVSPPPEVQFDSTTAKPVVISDNNAGFDGGFRSRSFQEHLKSVPWWGWALTALGVSCCGGVLCGAACCCGKDSSKRSTRAARLEPSEEDRPASKESKDEVTQPLIPQLLPTPILQLPQLGAPLGAYTAVAPAQYLQAPFVLPGQRLVEVRSAPAPYSVMQAPAAYYPNV